MPGSSAPPTGAPGRCRALLASAVMGVAPLLAAAPPDNPPVPELPAPAPGGYRLPSLQPWPAGARPKVPGGFRVEVFAERLDAPRSLYVLPGGEVLVAQARTERMAGLDPGMTGALTRQGLLGPSANDILLLRPGQPPAVFLSNLHQPYGMALLDGWFYVANTDGILRFRYRPGDTSLYDSPRWVIDIPAAPDNNHWTRNLAVAPDGRHLLVAVGSATNINVAGNDPPDRAAIWEISPDGSGKRLVATGLRNPVGLDFEPRTGVAWTTVNERDGLGEDVPPDYLARVVDGATYGWPYVYFGTYPDPTWQEKDPDRVAAEAARARVPDLALGAHSVPLGLHFYRGDAFPAHYRDGAFIARRGGVGRSRLLGMDVIFVPFAAGRPTGAIEPFMTGFIADADRGIVHGRPAGLAELPDGSLLVADEAGNRIWRISFAAPAVAGDR